MKTLHKPLPAYGRRQAGAALVTGLIFMVILTLLAIAAMRTTTLEELMARNARDRDLAFQAAEAALRAGEARLEEAVLPSFAAGTAYTPRIADGSRSDYWIGTHNWTQSQAVGFDLADTSARPRFVVELLSTGAGSGGGLGIGALTDQGMYRVTARGAGGSANTFVILQAVYHR